MTEEGKIRLGVIGAGWFVSRRHLPDTLKTPSLQLTALCRRDDDARRKMAAHFDVPEAQAYADWRQMLDDAPLDAVLIATPNSLHFEQAKAALERGLHVLVEKPMTIRSEDARELVRIARERDRKLSVAVNPPYLAHCHVMRQELADPRMGPLESATMFWTGTAEYVFGRAPAPDNLPGVVPPTMYRADPELNGGGYFIDGGSHLVSEMLWVTQLRARRVSALMDATPSDMRTVLTLEMENGALASITGIGDSKFNGRRVHNVFGTSRGTITVNEFAFQTKITCEGETTREFLDADLPPVGTPVGNFAEAILGRQELFSPGEHGAHVVEVMEAAYLSASTGRSVEIGTARQG